MRAPIAEKLAELRKEIQRIQATPRKGFTPKQREAVFRAYDGLCAGCDEPLKAGWQIDHIKELADGGAHEPANWQPLCGQNQNGCHVGKTSSFRTRKAKAERIVKREERGQEPSRLRSRPFQQRTQPYRWPKQSLGRRKERA